MSLSHVRPSRLLLISMSLTVIIVVSIVWGIRLSQSNTEQALETIREMERLRGQITYMDEAMTMSANMAAQTGDSQWQSRHQYFAPQLDEAIKKAMAVVLQTPDVKSNNLTILLQSNDVLWALENEAFALISQNKLAAAKDILVSTQYEQAKKAYSEMLVYVETKVGVYQGRVHLDNQRYFYTTIVTSTVLTLLLVALWLWIYRLVVHFQSRQDRTLLESEAQLEAIFESVDVNIVIVDHAGCIDGLNRAALAAFGYTANQLVGKTIDKIIVGGISVGDVFQNREMQAQGTAGRMFPVRVSVNRIERDERSLFVVIASDMTEQKAAEKSLLLAKDRAEEGTRAKSEFLATMSHEIRTPMNGVVGYASLLGQTGLTADQSEMVASIQSSGENLLSIINDVLDFSKIEAHSVELEERVFSLPEMIESAMDIFRSRLRDGELKFSYTASGAMPEYISSDETRLRQILVNLISNAVKFTREGEVSISARVLQQRSDNILLEFKVSDTGVGIPQPKVDRLFEAFTQADSSITREYGGTGLGLTISKELVKLLGGDIWLTSKEGKGTTFYFSMHARAATNEQVKKLGQREAIKEIDTQLSKAHPMTILLVEDNRVNARIAVAMLNKLGYEVDTVVDGQEALDALAKTHYDLVLMDIQMPVMDGLESTRYIRSDFPRDRQPVIVALTANAFEEDRAACFSAGMDRFLSKPFTIESIQRLLIECSLLLREGRVGVVVEDV